MMKKWKITFSSILVLSMVFGINKYLQAQVRSYMSAEPNTDRKANDYDKIDGLANAEECREACLLDINCKSYTFVPEYTQPPHDDNRVSFCWLKDEIGTKQRRGGMTSGVRYYAR